MKEIWKDVPGSEGIYEASNLGRVKRLKYYGHAIDRILNSFKVKGYHYVSFNKRPFAVHRLVAMAFLGHSEFKSRKIVVDHIDNDKTNNKVENLQLLTARENTSKDRNKGSSKYTGVYWSNKDERWVAEILIEGNKYAVKYSTSEKEAYQAYQKALSDWDNDKIKPLRKEVSSKYTGVCLVKRDLKWKAYFTIKGIKYNVGIYDDEHTAHIEREKARIIELSKTN